MVTIVTTMIISQFSSELSATQYDTHPADTQRSDSFSSTETISPQILNQPLTDHSYLPYICCVREIKIKNTKIFQ